MTHKCTSMLHGYATVCMVKSKKKKKGKGALYRKSGNGRIKKFYTITNKINNFFLLFKESR